MAKSIQRFIGNPLLEGFILTLEKIQFSAETLDTRDPSSASSGSEGTWRTQADTALEGLLAAARGHQLGSPSDVRELEGLVGDVLTQMTAEAPAKGSGDETPARTEFELLRLAYREISHLLTEHRHALERAKSAPAVVPTAA